MQLNLLAIDDALHLATGTDDNSIHRHKGGVYLCKLLNTVYYYDIVVRIAD